jgi:lambda family phage portal protein
MGIIANVFDNAVAAVWPGLAVKRTLDREVLAKLAAHKDKGRSTYAAAKTNRLTGDWNPVDLDINELIRGSAPKVRARIRQLVRDFPIFKRAVTVVCDFQVADGLRFQSKAISPDGSPNQAARDIIEDAFKRWNDEADIAGKKDFYGMTRGIKRQELESGEFIVVRRWIKDRSRFLPFCLQEVETDMLSDNPSIAPGKGNEIESGLEYNKKTGQPAYFHFTDPDSWGKSIRVPASDVLQGFEPLRPGQMHGVSPFVSGVMVANDLCNYLESNIDTAKMASKYLAFVTKGPATRTSTLTDGVDDDEGKMIDEMENAIVEYLNPGESVDIAHANLPGANFSPTVKLILCMISAATDVPYELLSFDYTKLSYNAQRAIRNDFSQSIKYPIARMRREFCHPVGDWFLNSAYIHGGLNLPAYLRTPWLYERYLFQYPGSEMIDWLKESKARISEMGVSLRSPQEIIGARGRTLAEVLEETRQAVEMIKKADLEFLIPIIWKQPSLSVANNPAAIESQGNNGDKKKAELTEVLTRAGVSEDMIETLAEIADGVDILTNN